MPDRTVHLRTRTPTLVEVVEMFLYGHYMSKNNEKSSLGGRQRGLEYTGTNFACSLSTQV